MGDYTQTYNFLQIRKPKQEIRLLQGVGGIIRGTRYQANQSCKRGAFSFLLPLFWVIFSHTCMMGTLRTSTNVRVLTAVLPALLAGVEFCLVCLVCGLCWCCSSFWSVCFLFVFPHVVQFFFFKQKTAYEIQYGLVGSEMCIRDRVHYFPRNRLRLLATAGCSPVVRPLGCSGCCIR